MSFRAPWDHGKSSPITGLGRTRTVTREGYLSSHPLVPQQVLEPILLLGKKRFEGVDIR